MKKKKRSGKKIIIIIMIIIACVVGLGVGVYFVGKKVLNDMCPAGYELKSGWKCHMLIKEKAKKKVYCKEGYALNDKDVCVKTEYIDPKIEYYCDNTETTSGDVWLTASTLSGSVCSFTSNHYAVEKKECPNGFYPYNDDKCTGYMILNAPYSEFRGYYCVDLGNGVIQDGTKCKHIIYPNYNVYKVCIDGFVLNGDICTKYETYNARYNISCPDGYKYENNTCVKTTAIESEFDLICEEGYTLRGTYCETHIYADANKPWRK